MKQLFVVEIFKLVSVKTQNSVIETVYLLLRSELSELFNFFRFKVSYPQSVDWILLLIHPCVEDY